MRRFPLALRQIAAAFLLGFGLARTRRRLHDEHEGNDKDSAGQQRQSDNGVEEAVRRTVGVLETILQEYKTSNAEEDRQRPEDKKRQEHTLGWLIAYTLVTGFILVTSIWQSVSIQRQLYVALADERPWISIEPKPGSTFHFDDKGAHFAVDIVLDNTGHSPATGISIEARSRVLPAGQDFFLFSTQEVAAGLEDTCKTARRNGFSAFALFPGQTVSKRKIVDVAQSDIVGGISAETGIKKALFVAVDICVVYDAPGERGEARRTAFAYTVNTRKGDMGNPAVIILGEGDIPQDKWFLSSDLYAGSLAE